MSVAYEKEHFTYEQQVDKLIGRGLEVPERDRATTALQAIGYYRLSAYLHTFRPIKSDGTAGHDERLNTYYPGSSFHQVFALPELLTEESTRQPATTDIQRISPYD